VLSWLRFQIKENINVRRCLHSPFISHHYHSLAFIISDVNTSELVNRGVKFIVPGEGGIVSGYTHGKGKYVALVGLKVHSASRLDNKALETIREFGHRVAIQVVGFSPEFLDRKEVQQLDDTFTHSVALALLTLS